MDFMRAYAQEVEKYRAEARRKYKDLDQLDRIEAMMVDILAMIYVVGIVMPNSSKEFI